MRWTPVMSSFVLRRFVDLVGGGVKTDKGYKEVHVNQVARNLSEFTGQEVTGTQVSNHLRKWRQRWVKVCRLKDLSGATWDEDTFTIVLDDEHLLGHTKATGRFAMGSNEPLGTPSDFNDLTNEDVNGFGAAAGTSSSQNPRSSEEPSGKRRRSLTDEEVGMFAGLTGAVNRVADAFEAPVQVYTTDVHPGLYDACMGTTGFIEEDLMTAFTYLLDNKSQGEGFVAMKDNHRVLWLRQFLAKLRANATGDNE
ncbi:hypothetical protein QOZ80_8BG0647450 [Eleusine coracana subsp. coracana]|nr:hypothetical protein QOZ80_8BG0647450 [Eleusine coracana subsp. coracana]